MENEMSTIKEKEKVIWEEKSSIEQTMKSENNGELDVCDTIISINKKSENKTLNDITGIKNDYYVYVYYDPRKTPSEPIYVGKGRGNRMFHHLWRQTKTNIILKNKIKHIKDVGLTPIIVKEIDNLSNTNAIKLEMELIEKYGRIHNNTGTLCNFTDGGEGTCGFKKGPMSDESKEKLRRSRIGKIMSEDTKEKLRIANIGKKMSIESIEKTRVAHIGSKRSKETCEKIGLSKRGFKFSEESKRKISVNSKNKKPIFQLDLNGNFIKRWESIAECCKQNGYCESNISVCCSGKRNTAFGYKWQFQI